MGTRADTSIGGLGMVLPDSPRTLPPGLLHPPYPYTPYLRQLWK